MDRKKVLITGGEGMLGTACTHSFSRLYDVRSFGHKELDVNNKHSLFSQLEWKPDLVIHAAALVNADYCEENPDECRKTQVGGTDNVIAFCKKAGAKLFYPQSFLIFDGKELPIRETTTPHPLSVYGKAKLEAERHVLQELSDSLMIRMAGFFGGYEKDKNFVGKFARHLKKCIDEGTESIDVGDRIWQPTYTEDLAMNSLRLVQKNKSGIYNMACEGHASFFELATAMVQIVGISDKIKINRISSAALRERCVRPAVAIMENTRLQKEGLDAMRPWREALKTYLSAAYFKEMFRSA